MAKFRYQCLDCGKTYIGPQLAGGMECSCDDARTGGKKKSRGTRIVTPLSNALLEVVSVSESATRRDALCTRWGIKNKSHEQHGSNFSSNQTMVNLIHNIVQPVTGELYESVRRHIIRDYAYDISTREMTY